MKHLIFSVKRPVGLLLAFLLVAPVCSPASTPLQTFGQQGSSSSSVSSSSAAQTATDAAPQDNAAGSNNRPAHPLEAQPISETKLAQSEPPQSNVQTNPPATGTAVAPYEKQVGVTGSKPAGAAIAAGKQRRTRSFAIRVGLIVGAAIAVGVVAGASLGSPARAN